MLGVGFILLFSVFHVTCENPLTNLVKRPKINLRQETTSISTGESFDFGTVAVNDSKDVVFTIENNGTTALNLTNTPRVIITGSTAFVVLTAPPAAVAAGSTASFTVRFTPQDTTLVAATISIKSDDPDTGTYVVTFSGKGSGSTLTDAQSVAADKASLQITYASGDSASSVTQDMTFPSTGSSGTTISWSSDTPGAISNTGVVVRPAAGATNATVMLTATILKNTTSDTKQFTLTVLKNPVSDAQSVADDKAGLQITFAGGDSISSVTQNMTLPTAGSSGTTISWASDITSIVSVAGVVIRPASTTVVTLTATITKGAANDSKVFAITVIMATPAAPGSLIVQATSASAIHLSWTDASTNEYGFKVERSPDGVGGWNQVHLTAANATSWDDAGLASATTYFYRVRSTNAGGDSAYSSIASATTNQALPAAPTGLSASALSVSSIRLTWTDNSTNETGFKIERSPDGATGWTQLTTTAANVITYDNTGLSAGTTYYYRVRATNTSGDSPYSNTFNISTFSPTPEINIKQSSTDIPSGSGSFNYGTVLTNIPVYRSFIIENTGTAELTLSGPVLITGSDAGLYLVTVQPSSPIPALASSTFTIRFIPTSIGDMSATVFVLNNDSNEGNYSFSILGSGTVPVVSLPKTGQTTSYISEDDGDLEKGVIWSVPRFTTGTNVVTDNLTGLMWTKNGNLIVTESPTFDQDGIVNDGAVTWQHSFNYVAHLNTVNFGGFSDWRLPNWEELRSLVNYGQPIQTSWLSSQGFSNVQAFYWSSTTSLNSTERAWCVEMGGGGYVDFDFNKTDSYYVFAVRGGQ